MAVHQASSPPPHPAPSGPAERTCSVPLEHAGSACIGAPPHTEQCYASALRMAAVHPAHVPKTRASADRARACVRAYGRPLCFVWWLTPLFCLAVGLGCSSFAGGVTKGTSTRRRSSRAPWAGTSTRPSSPTSRWLSLGPCLARRCCSLPHLAPWSLPPAPLAHRSSHPLAPFARARAHTCTHIYTTTGLAVAAARSLRQRARTHAHKYTPQPALGTTFALFGVKEGRRM